METSKLLLEPQQCLATGGQMQQPPRNFVADPFPYGHELELLIEDLTNLGDGVARHDGWVIFVPFALPGERVRARIWRNKRKYSDADLVAVLEPSVDRIEPVCPLFGDCGGCQYQHYAYSAQLEWKRRQIAALLRKLAGIEHEVNACIAAADHAYGYRSKITPHFRRPPHIAGTPIGFQRFASRSIVDVPQCPIASNAINEQLHHSRVALQNGRLPFKRGGTLLLRDSLDGVVTDMRAEVTEKVGDYCFRFVAGEFFQNNPHVLPMMVDYVIGMAKGKDGDVDYLVDAYCGVGVFAICGHQQFLDVTGVEVNEQAGRLAHVNIADNNAANVRVAVHPAEGIFAGLDYPAARTAVIMDPPRKGSSVEFIEQLIAFGPRRIVYVSCGPDTQARDLKLLLDAGYRVVDVQPVDLFPQTRHIENIVTLISGADSSDH
jgi:23S rRNA (uracil1939-C5)-methyltransferase/tRNA (uracil-5-)-methyltransferase